MSKRIVIAVLLMLFISWGSSKGYDINFFQTIPPIEKHSINFFLLILVALIGYYSLTQFSEKWLLIIWILVYSIVVILLVCIGIIDVCYPIKVQLIRDSIVPFRMFFISPIPFLIILFFKYMLKKSMGQQE